MAKTSTPTADHAAVEDGDVHVHAHPLSMYLGVFGALIVLTLLTVGAYQVHLFVNDEPTGSYAFCGQVEVLFR